jgi:hypothetical protein
VSERYREYIRSLREAVLGPGRTDPSLRSAVESRAAALGGRSGAGGDMPGELRPFVDKIATQAYRVTDEDIDGLRRAGWSEGAIFEICASAALGAGLGRLERGMAALRGEV